MQNGSCGGRPPPIAPGLHPLGYSLYPPLYLPRRLGPGGLRERSPPGTAKGPRREERSPLARPGDQPTEGRGRAGRGRGRPGGSRRGFGAEGPGGSPPWRGGRAVRPTRSSPRASRRTEGRSRPSRPEGVARRAGGRGRRAIADAQGDDVPPHTFDVPPGGPLGPRTEHRDPAMGLGRRSLSSSLSGPLPCRYWQFGRQPMQGGRCEMNTL